MGEQIILQFARIGGYLMCNGVNALTYSYLSLICLTVQPIFQKPISLTSFLFEAFSTYIPRDIATIQPNGKAPALPFDMSAYT